MKPMKPLTYRQVSRCELAQGDRCRCRCGGRLHGARRAGGDPRPGWFQALPRSDPHWLPVPEIRREIIRQCLEYRHALRGVQLPLDL